MTSRWGSPEVPAAAGAGAGEEVVVAVEAVEV